MPFDPSAPFEIETPAAKFDPTAPFEVEVGERVVPTQDSLPVRPSITSLLDKTSSTISIPDASSSFAKAPADPAPAPAKAPAKAPDDQVAIAFNRVVQPDWTVKQSMAAAVKLLDLDRDRFDPAQYMKDHPDLNTLFTETVLEVYKARSREGLIASRVISKIPEALIGYDTEGSGLAGQIGSGIVGQLRNIGKATSVIPLPEGERALAAKKVAASTVTAVGGGLDMLRTGLRKIGDASPLAIVPRAINWAITPGADAKDIISGSGGPSDDAGWQARLNSDVAMLHRMEAARTGQNLPGAPLTEEQASEVDAMSTVDPVTLVAGAGLAKAAGLIGKGAALTRLPKIATAPLTAEQTITQTLAARTAGAAPGINAAEIAAEIAADTAAKATAAAVGTGPLAPRVSAVLNAPVVKSSLTAGALTGLSEKDEQAAAMAGLGVAGAAVSGRSTGIKQNLPIAVEGINALGGVANLADKASVGIPRLLARIPSVAAPALGAGVGAALGGAFGIPAGVAGALIGAPFGGLVRRGVTAMTDRVGSSFKRGAESIANEATIVAHELKHTAGGLKGDQGIYRLPSDEAIQMASKVSPELGKQVAQEFNFNKDATLKAISADPLATALVDPKLIDAMAFEQPILLNRTLEVVAKSPLEQLLGLDPLKSTKEKSRKVLAAKKNIQADVDRQAGPLKQPPEAFMPLTTEVLPDGTGAVVGFGKPLIDATVRKVFDTPELLKEFKLAGRLTPDGKQLNQLGADYLLSKFDEANALQLEDIMQPDGSVTRTFKSAKPLDFEAQVKENQTRTTGLIDVYNDRRAELIESLNILKADKTFADVDPSLDANVYRRSKLSKMAEINTRVIELGAKFELDSRAQAADLVRIKDERSNLGAALRTLDLLGILDVVPERVPLSKIQSTTRLPRSKGSPIRNAEYRAKLKAGAERPAVRRALSVMDASTP